MTLSNSRLAYADCYRILDQALKDSTGVRVRIVDPAAGTHLRMRLHQARKIDREDNTRTYERDHPMYGRSPYDVLVVRAPAEDRHGWWLKIDKPEATEYEIEPLSGNLLEDNSAPEPLAIEDRSDIIEAYEENETKPVDEILAGVTTFRRRI